MARNSAASAVLVGGSIGGALDITYAIVFAGLHGLPPTRLLQTVASGLLGSAAFDGGAGTAALGLFAHFAMAFLIAGIFYGVSRFLPFLTRRPVISGLLFGVIVFLVMRLVVLPLSAFPYPVTFKPLATATDLMSHMFFFGLPIALAVRKFAPLPGAVSP
jgi:uncharacterized membrane protein YagU involved in acid resistance